MKKQKTLFRSIASNQYYFFVDDVCLEIERHQVALILKKYWIEKMEYYELMPNRGYGYLFTAYLSERLF